MKVSATLAIVIGFLVLLSAGAGYALRSATQPEAPSAAVPTIAPSPETTATAAPSPTPSLMPEATATNQPAPSPTAEPSPTTAPAADLNFQITMVSLREEDPEYSIDVQYPQLGLAMDASIQEVVDTNVTDLKELVATSPPGSFGSPGPYALDVSMESAYMSADIVSIRLSAYTYTGGAHGNTIIHAFNFDPSTGTELGVSDALTLLDMSLPEVAQQVEAELTARLNGAYFADGALPVEENYQTFLVSPMEVTFVFQQYQVAPYAAGSQEVSFPRTADR